MYLLHRAATRADPAHGWISTYDERVEVTREGGVMVARVRSVYARDALRRKGFHVVAVPLEPTQAATARPEAAPAPPRQPMASPPATADMSAFTETIVETDAAVVESLGMPAELPPVLAPVVIPGRRVPQPPAPPKPTWDAREWAAEIGEAAGSLLPVDAGQAIALNRSVLEAATSKGRTPPVDIVLVTTGWGAREAIALAALLPKARATKARIVVVENSGADGIEIEAPTTVVVVRTANRGFSAACNAGLAKIRKTAKAVLFTQADVEFTLDDLTRAARLAVAGNATVGPSGGLLHGNDLAQVSEWGRNVGIKDHAPRAVDFVAGYWLVIPTGPLAAIGGWDAGFALYYEDPDLCLRLALAGCRSVAWPSLKVDHDRGATIRSRMSDNERERIREVSRARFVARWGAK